MGQEDEFGQEDGVGEEFEAEEGKKKAGMGWGRHIFVLYYPLTKPFFSLCSASELHALLQPQTFVTEDNLDNLSGCRVYPGNV